MTGLQTISQALGTARQHIMQGYGRYLPQFKGNTATGKVSLIIGNNSVLIEYIAELDVYENRERKVCQLESATFDLMVLESFSDDGKGTPVKYEINKSDRETIEKIIYYAIDSAFYSIKREREKFMY